MKANKISAEIVELGIEGDGICIIEKEKHYVPFTNVGDLISFDQEALLKKTSITDYELLEPSKFRAKPVCVHYTHCGGCKLQHLNSEQYANHKISTITKHLEFHRISPNKIEEIIILPKQTRRRVSLSFVLFKKGSEIKLGYSRANSNEIINVKECHIVTKDIERILEPLRSFILGLGITEKLSGIIYILDSDNGLDIVIRLHNSKRAKEKIFPLFPDDITKKLNDFILQHDVSRIDICKKYFANKKDVFAQLGDFKVPVDATQFLQASKNSELIMQNIVSNYLPNTKIKVADLFSGIGTFTLNLVRRHNIDAFEVCKDSVSVLSRVLQQYLLHPSAAFQRDLFSNPLKSEEISKYAAVIINPPRAGALHQIQEIAKSSTQYVVYVSCNPSSFARDAKILTESGFRLESITPIDQFLWSPHLELIAQFVK